MLRRLLPLAAALAAPPAAAAVRSQGAAALAAHDHGGGGVGEQRETRAASGPLAEEIEIALPPPAALLGDEAAAWGRPPSREEALLFPAGPAMVGDTKRTMKVSVSVGARRGVPELWVSACSSDAGGDCERSDALAVWLRRNMRALQRRRFNATGLCDGLLATAAALGRAAGRGPLPRRPVAAASADALVEVERGPSGKQQARARTRSSRDKKDKAATRCPSCKAELSKTVDFTCGHRYCPFCLREKLGSTDIEKCPMCGAMPGTVRVVPAEYVPRRLVTFPIVICYGMVSTVLTFQIIVMDTLPAFMRGLVAAWIIGAGLLLLLASQGHFLL